MNYGKDSKFHKNFSSHHVNGKDAISHFTTNREGISNLLVSNGSIINNNNNSLNSSTVANKNGFTPEDRHYSAAPLPTIVIFYDTGPVFREVFGSQTFQDFADFEAKFLRFQELTGVIFRIKSSVSVGAENKKRTVKIDDKFKYGGVTYICVRHGINKTPKGTSCNCKAYLSLSYKTAIQRLYVTSANTKHNHSLPINNPDVLLVPEQVVVAPAVPSSAVSTNLQHFINPPAPKNKYSACGGTSSYNSNNNILGTTTTTHSPSSNLQKIIPARSVDFSNSVASTTPSADLSFSTSAAAVAAAAAAASFFYNSYHHQQSPLSPIQNEFYEQQRIVPSMKNNEMKVPAASGSPFSVAGPSLSTKNKGLNDGAIPNTQFPPSKFSKYDFLAAAEQYRKFYDNFASNFKFPGNNAPAGHVSNTPPSSWNKGNNFPPGLNNMFPPPPLPFLPPEFANFAQHFAQTNQARNGATIPAGSGGTTNETHNNNNNFLKANKKLSTYNNTSGPPGGTNSQQIGTNSKLSASSSSHNGNSANIPLGSTTAISQSFPFTMHQQKLVNEFFGAGNQDRNVPPAIHQTATPAANVSRSPSVSNVGNLSVTCNTAVPDYSSILPSSHTAPQSQPTPLPPSKYTQLLAVIEDMGRDIRPAYAGSRVAAERLKRGIVHSRILVRECLLEAEKCARS